ncbi:hypothetical protein [Phytohabitans kaempferiae]|uniref:Transposase n=1 Tax=Phytohabitans kaempferiae TaxID=1620943 RepID=A0ABV6M750_9ACTN
MANKDTAAEEKTAAGGRAASADLEVRVAQELIDQARTLLLQVTRTVLQTGLRAEMSEHLGCEKGDLAGQDRGATTGLSA